MKSHKELFNEEFSSRVAELVEAGMDEGQAYDQVENEPELVMDRATDRYASQADDARERAKFRCQTCRVREALFDVGGVLYCSTCKPKELVT